jgi:hypothetical protein
MFAAYLISRGAGVEEAITRAATVTRDDQRAFLVGLAAGLLAGEERDRRR